MFPAFLCALPGFVSMFSGLACYSLGILCMLPGMLCMLPGVLCTLPGALYASSDLLCCTLPGTICGGLLCESVGCGCAFLLAPEAVGNLPLIGPLISGVCESATSSCSF
jgi:hypothetical protein